MNCISRSMTVRKTCFNLKNVGGCLVQTKFLTVKSLSFKRYEYKAVGTIYQRFDSVISNFLAVHSRCSLAYDLPCPLSASFTRQLNLNVLPSSSSLIPWINVARYYSTSGSGIRDNTKKKIDSSCNVSDLVDSGSEDRHNSTCDDKCGTPMTTTSNAGEKIKCSDPILPDDTKLDGDVVEKKLSIFQKFKEMYRDYWYVLLPVHCVTSVFWYGGFYFLAESGVDVVSVLEYVGISETLVEPFRNGNAHAKAGYIAVAFALYKIATPIRYTVTLGGTTVAINYLKRWGYIKPIPKKEQLKAMYLEQKDILMEKKQQLKSNVLQHLKEVDGSSGSKRK